MTSCLVLFCAFYTFSTLPLSSYSRGVVCYTPCHEHASCKNDSKRKHNSKQQNKSASTATDVVIVIILVCVHKSAHGQWCTGCVQTGGSATLYITPRAHIHVHTHTQPHSLVWVFTFHKQQKTYTNEQHGSRSSREHTHLFVCARTKQPQTNKRAPTAAIAIHTTPRKTVLVNTCHTTHTNHFFKRAHTQHLLHVYSLPFIIHHIIPLVLLTTHTKWEHKRNHTLYNKQQQTPCLLFILAISNQYTLSDSHHQCVSTINKHPPHPPHHHHLRLKFFKWRTPHALHKLLGPVGPARHTGVDCLLHAVH